MHPGNHQEYLDPPRCWGVEWHWLWAAPERRRLPPQAGVLLTVQPTQVKQKKENRVPSIGTKKRAREGVGERTQTVLELEGEPPLEDARGCWEGEEESSTVSFWATWGSRCAVS